MVKRYDSDFEESDIRYTLPTEEFVFQALSNKMSLDVCRFGGTTYAWNPALASDGKKYNEVYYLALVDGEEVVQRVDYSFLDAIRDFLKEKKSEDQSTDLKDYKIKVSVKTTRGDGYDEHDYTIVKSAGAKNRADIDEKNEQLEAKLSEMEAKYQGDTDNYLRSLQPAAKKTAAPALKSKKTPVAKSKQEELDEDDVDDEDLPF